MTPFLKTEIQFLKGVGQVRAEILNKELGIFTFEDLLLHYPFRYVDRRHFQNVADLTHDVNELVQLKGRIIHLEEVGFKHKSRLVATFYDGTGEIDLVWFKGTKWLKANIVINDEIVIFGKPTYFKNKISMNHPEMEPFAKRAQNIAMEPVYTVTETMRNRRFESKQLRQVIQNLLEHEAFNVPEFYTDEMRKTYKLVDRSQAFRFIHRPPSPRHADAARYRLKFEELFFLQLPFLRQKLLRNDAHLGIPFEPISPLFQKFCEKHLPFELTNAQVKVLQEIKTDLCSGNQMNRLLQGDVGSGKTIVAFLSVLMAIDNRCQASIMAPTEILATQHYLGLKEMAEAIGIQIALLTGSTPTSERKELHRLLRLGEIHLLIGTHALIEEVVQFQNLGLVIIDEQHRFGVAQRAKLQSKGQKPPHVLVMTATPIPRTLAMSLYGDLDYSVIDELPAGRKAIKTVHRFGFARTKVWEFIKDQIAKGRQAYIVYPLIEESEKLHYRDLNNGYDDLLQFFPRPEYQVDMLHGKMKAKDKEAVMQRFKNGESHIVVSTTVIEVGINVPNASIMVIESSEKFGLSQLHQLRGRVGRGAEQSYCILLSSKKLSDNAKTRLKAMVKTNSGFELSEIDMQLRGFGDIAGTRQSGLEQLKLASLGTDSDIAQNARKSLIELLSNDPELEKNPKLLTHIRQNREFKDWIKIA